MIRNQRATQNNKNYVWGPTGVTPKRVNSTRAKTQKRAHMQMANALKVIQLTYLISATKTHAIQSNQG